ncbi:MAG: FtsK/SpoIIIE domain-containing protein [Parcubacteria group bacterium]
MSLLSLFTRDKPGAGTRLSDAMIRLTGVCYQCGLVDTDASGQRHAQVRAGRTIAPERGPVTSHELIVSPRALKRVLAMHREFAAALNVSSVTVRQEGGSVWVDVPTSHPGHLTYEEAWAMHPDLPHGHVLLGVNGHGDQLALDLPNAPHCAVIGMSNSGKSTLLRTMVHSCQSQQGITVAIMDPKSDMAPLSGFGHVWQGGYFERPEEIEACLCYLTENTRHNTDGLLFVFVDEAPWLCKRPRIREALVQLANMGRHDGIHLVLGAQSPSELGAALMSNMGVTIIGRMRDAQHAAQASGQRGTGAERIAEPGRFIVTKGEARRDLQAAMMTRQLIDKLTWEWPPRHGVVPSTPEPTPMPADSHQAAQAALDTSSSGAPGRAPDDLPADVRARIVRYYVQHSRRPTRRQVSAWCGVPGGLDNDKWHRWLSESLGVHA